MLLVCKGKVLKDNFALNTLPNDLNICVLLKNCLCGGAKEREICGVDASYECKDCDQQFYEGCCHKVHQHNKRCHYLPQKFNLEFIDDSGIEITHVGADRNSDTTAAVCAWQH